MKTGVHPDYNPITILCTGCQMAYETRSTAGKDYHVEICSNCHPFFTGKQRLLDTAGRVERFRRKYGKVEDKTAAPEATETPAS